MPPSPVEQVGADGAEIVVGGVRRKAGPFFTSPIARTPGTIVSSLSSTRTQPFSSVLVPTATRFSRSVCARPVGTGR